MKKPGIGRAVLLLALVVSGCREPRRLYDDGGTGGDASISDASTEGKDVNQPEVMNDQAASDAGDTPATTPGADAADASPDAVDAGETPDSQDASQAGDMGVDSPTIFCFVGDPPRSCAAAGLMGSCASGTQSCVGGAWGPCSILPQLADSCERGNDDSCNGQPNENCVPQCIGRHVADKFCMGAAVYQCGPNLTTTSLVTTCMAPMPACMEGACGACISGTRRSCMEDGLMGPCAVGTETCNANGAWGPCSILPKAADSCDSDSDDNCNGKRHENCVCVNNATDTCANALGKKGACGADTATCKNGQWTGCLDTKGPDTCDLGNDNNCNDKKNENCVCINNATDTCGHALGKKGTCASGVTRCSGGQWGTCDTTPKSVDLCEFGNDDMCTGVPVGDLANNQCICSGFIMPNTESSGLINSASYVDNGDATIKEQVSGLIWEKSPGPTAAQCTGEGSATTTFSAVTCTQTEAIAYCKAKGAGWHLPTRLELVSLLDTFPSGGGGSALVGGAFSGTPPEGFWTSSLVAGDPSSAWYISFGTGRIDNQSLFGTLRVRCVR